LTVRHAHRVPADPLLRLGLENHAIRAGPLNRVDRVEILVVLLVVPELPAFASRHICDPERQRVAAGERRRHQPGARIARLGRGAAAATASTPALSAAATGANRVQRVIRGTVRVADASQSLVRLLTKRGSRSADERDALAVRRPGGTAVVIDAGCEEPDRARAH